MNTQNMFRVVALAVTTLGATLFANSASAQQQTAIDSVSKHVRAHPKPKKTTAAPVAAAKSSSAAGSAKAKRETPAIFLPGAQASVAKQAAPATVAKKTTAAPDSVPPVKRAARVSKPKPPR